MIKFSDGEVLHVDQTTGVATAVNHEDNKLFTFINWHFHSGWPVRGPAVGDKLRLRWGSDGAFLSARLDDD